MDFDIAVDPDAPTLDGWMIFHVAFIATTDGLLPGIENGSIDATERLLIDPIKNCEEYDGDLNMQNDDPPIF